MSPQHKHTSPFQADRIFLCLLACVYLGYLIALGGFLHTAVLTPVAAITEHSLATNPNSVVKYWTTARMRNAVDADQQSSNVSDLTQMRAGKAASQQGQSPSDGSLAYPVSTVGKVFFTNAAGFNSVCSGTAVASLNDSIVDTAGHCLYRNGNWSQNLIFCPLYNNGSIPYGCWAARALEVPADWINAKLNDYHHDFGMAIVNPNSKGLLTNLVGGAGWAYNQSVNQSFSAYGYPAAYPFNGQTRQSCENSSGTGLQHGDGTVVAIVCNMTGGSSGGPWFMKIGNNWYLNGHNDFINGSQPGYMFSPYYDDTWYALYNKAQHT